MMGNSGHTSTFLYNIKQKRPHPFDTPDGNPCNTLLLHRLTFRADSQLPESRSFVPDNAGESEERGWRSGWFNRKGVSVCSSLIFCETGEVTWIWNGTSSLTFWVSWNVTFGTFWACEVRET